MFSAVLRSETAIKTSICIINTFVEMRKFLMNNAQLFQRLENIELKQLESDKRIDEIFTAFEFKTAKPKHGIFYNGQIYEAYIFVADLVRSAKSSLLLIDNYVDDSVITLLSKREENVSVTICTAKINKQLLLDVEKHNAQYAPI